MPAKLRSILLAAATSVALISPFMPVQAQTTPLTTIRVASPAVDVTGNLFYALDLGYFKQAGLDVQLTTLAAGADAVAAVIGGAVEVGSSNLVAIALAHEAGFPVVLVAPSGGNSVKFPIDAIVVAKDSPIKTAKDLSGKTIVTSALQNILQVQVDAWMDKNGGDYKSVKWIQAPPPQEAGVVATGHADAATITETFLSAALANGDVRLLADTGNEVSPIVIEGRLFLQHRLREEPCRSAQEIQRRRPSGRSLGEHTPRRSVRDHAEICQVGAGENRQSRRVSRHVPLQRSPAAHQRLSQIRRPESVVPRRRHRDSRPSLSAIMANFSHGPAGNGHGGDDFRGRVG